MNHEKPTGKRMSGEEVAKHNSQESCWVIVNGLAYDVTGVYDDCVLQDYRPMADHINQSSCLNTLVE